MLLEIALTVAAVVFCLKKWGALDWYSVYRRRWMPAADCYFCISFWLSLPVCVALLDKGWYGALAFACAALSAFVLTLLINNYEQTNEQRRANMDRIQAEAEATLKENGTWDDVVTACEAIDNGKFTKDMFDSIPAPDANPEN